MPKYKVTYRCLTIEELCVHTRSNKYSRKTPSYFQGGNMKRNLVVLTLGVYLCAIVIAQVLIGCDKVGSDALIQQRKEEAARREKMGTGD